MHMELDFISFLDFFPDLKKIVSYFPKIWMTTILVGPKFIVYIAKMI